MPAGTTTRSEFNIGEFITDMGYLGWGGAVTGGIAVGCPHCRFLFMLNAVQLKDLAGQARQCPYCEAESLIPSELPRFQDIRVVQLD